MPKGKCTVCGKEYRGWALENRITACDKCKGPVLLVEGSYRWERLKEAV